jgi:hypothetical protein
MRERHLRLVMGFTALATVMASGGLAMELGELQAVPGAPPPYVFRLAIHRSPEDRAESPAVAVRRPHTALSVVKKNMLELQLPSLMDVELEVSSGAQTLNRLLLKAELQAAHSRMEATTAWSRVLTAKTQQAPRAQMAALLETAYQTHRTWAQFDPAAQQELARVARERQRFHMAPVRQVQADPEESRGRGEGLGEEPLATSEATSIVRGEAVEHEMRTIREAISGLLVGVAPWGGVETPAWGWAEGSIGGWQGLSLVGVCLLGVTSLLTGCILQRRLSKQAAQRRRVLRVMERQTPMSLRRRLPELATGTRVQATAGYAAVRRSTTVIHHVRVSQRIRLQPLRRRQECIPSPPVRAIPPTSGNLPSRAHTPSALIDALERLRAELLNLQRLSSAIEVTEPLRPRSGRHHR